MKINNAHFDCNNCQNHACILKDLSNNELEVLKQHSVSARIKKGDVLFRQHVPVSYIMYIKEGIVKTYIENKKEKNVILNIHKSGQLFGVRCYLNSSAYPYSAMAIEDAAICYILPSVFNDLLETNKSFCYHTLTLISKESLYLNQKLHLYMKSLLPGKIANALLYLSDEIYQQDEFQFPFTKTEFSQLIGASRERVSKVLTELSNDKIIGFNNRTLAIHSKELLQHLSKIG